MSKKKLFASPRVLQEVQIQLEKDLLARSDTDTRAIANGQYYEDTDYVEADQDWTSE